MKTYIYLLILLIFLKPVVGESQNLPSAKEIIDQVNARNEGQFVTQKFTIELIDRRGKKQLRETISYRKDYTGERKTALFFSSPTHVKGTGFLTFDYQDKSKDDDQWLYLPALRKTRRISAANRGDYFLGTDLTYEDIKKGTKIDQEDFVFKTVKEISIGDKQCYLIEAIPVDEKVAKELKYSKVHFYIDKNTWISVKTDYWDVSGNKLKTTEVTDMKRISEIWTVQRIEAKNYKTGHQSILTFSEVDYEAALDDDLFSEQRLVRGL